MEKKSAARVVATIAGLLLLGAGAWLIFGKPDSIVVASTSGEYMDAQSTALFAPFTEESGTVVRIAMRGDLGYLASQVEAGNLKWDVMDLSLGEAAEACRKGILETLNHSLLPNGADGRDATADFVPGALGPCWVASAMDSETIAFDPRRFPQALPSTAADFFDPVKFPGGRGLRDTPRGTLELALMADGVPAGGVYDVLSTPEGVSRALLKLESIRAVTWWWKSPDEPLAMLTDGRAVMVSAPHARIARDARIGVMWDGQRYDLHVLAIARGTLRKRNARDFVQFATSPSPLARFAEATRLGPTRRSSLTLMSEPARSASPTAHLENALAIDPNWWAVQGPAIEARWREWRRR